MNANRETLGGIIDEHPNARWRTTLRPLTKWELGMREKRTDQWAVIDDAVYRLAMPFAQLVEFETSYNTGVGRLFGRLAGTNEPLQYADTPFEHAAGLLRLSLIGGAMGVRNGVTFRVSATDALKLVDDLAAGPLVGLWDLARGVARAVQFGRPATQEEIDTFTIPAGAPLVPAWAMEHRA